MHGLRKAIPVRNPGMQLIIFVSAKRIVLVKNIGRIKVP
jgi:hypothetical protein